MPRCTTCRAEIIFARTPARKLMPLDADDAPATGLPPHVRWRFDESEQRTWLDRSDQGRAYVSHFAVCPRTQPTPPTDPVLRERWETNQERCR